ncbi:MAG: hypothetical protein ACKO6N_03815 [Myxococcota bacterium]
MKLTAPWMMAFGLSCALSVSSPLAEQSVAQAAPADAAPAAAPADAAPAAAPAEAAAPAAPQVSAGTAPASRPIARLYLGSLSVIRLNPVGLETQNKIAFNHKLYASSNPFLANNFLELAAMLKLNPAYLKVGPLVELQPASVFNLRLGYEYLRFFGTVNYLQSYDLPSADYSDPTRNDVTDALAYATSGHHLFAEPTLQMKLGAIAVRAKWAFEYWNMGLNDSDANGVMDTVFYDATLDTLVPGNGFIWTQETQLVYAKNRLTVGLQYNAVHPVYGEAQGASELAEGFDLTTHRKIGPLIAYAFNTREFTKYNRPTLLLSTGYYVKHQYRDSISTPYILVGFAFNSDLAKLKR